MTPKKRPTSILISLLVLALALSLVPEQRTLAQPPAPGPTSAALAKIHPQLQRQITQAQGMPRAAALQPIEIVVHVRAGADLSAVLPDAIVRPFVDPMGQQLVIGAAPANALLKIAANPDVIDLLPFAAPVDPPQPPEPGPPLESSDERPGQARAAATAGWWDAEAGHHFRQAWDLGYSGEGVTVMVNDSGTDFAHPDLMNTWAVVTDPASPYAGWPMMFDSFSMFRYVSDHEQGTTYVRDGTTDYADTSAVCAEPCLYAPINASTPHTYTLPATSASGVYHIGSHPDTSLADMVNGDWDGRAEGEERIAVLVVDENQAGVYDTVYVDLNGDFDFRNDKPVTKADPLAYLDNWDSAASGPGSDGWPDVSGGLLYFIADGVHPIPASDWLWGKALAPPPDNGALLAFAINDYIEGSDHGQTTASNVAGQGRIDGNAPAWKPAGDGSAFTGMVQGAGREAKLTTNGNGYRTTFGLEEDAFLFAALGYDGVAGTGDDSQIISNSWGDSGVHNDGWDNASRWIDAVVRRLNPQLAVVFSSGNFGPGYGTLAPPAPATAIQVGAATQYGSTNSFESIAGLDQITYGDVTPFSSRGPSARGANGVHVTANGAWGAGATSLNEKGDGWISWKTWGGTSRSAPIAAGTLALVYQAYKQAHGAWPNYETARAILMASAHSQQDDPLSQGAGTVDAGRAVKLAAGLEGAYVTPPAWEAGDYHGADHPAFAHILSAGDAMTQTFTVHNPSDEPITVDVAPEQLTLIKSEMIPFTPADPANEEGSASKPDYIIWLNDRIPEGTDLLEITLTIPETDLDPNGDNNADHGWMLRVHDWKDVNENGRLWEDLNEDGVVQANEIDPNEYNRFSWDYPLYTAMQVRVKQPLERMHDGVFVGLRHYRPQAGWPSHLQVQAKYFRRDAFPWLAASPAALTVPAHDTELFTATLTVPADAPVGLANGALSLTFANAEEAPRGETILPVTANVAAQSSTFEFGGSAPASTPYDNGWMGGHLNWLQGRPANGDWRFYFTDLPETLPDGARLLVDAAWTSAWTDVDALVMGPTPDEYSQGEEADPDFYGPYMLSILPGSSPELYQGRGVWQRFTNTGGPREIVGVDAQPGLHLLALHQTRYGGEAPAEAVSGRVGLIATQPPAIDLESRGEIIETVVTVTASIPLDDLLVEGYGLSAPEFLEDQPVQQDDPDDPNTASFTHTVQIDHAAVLDVQTFGQEQDDLDLFVYDPSGALVAESSTATADESALIPRPQDGEWTIAVHGWSVPGGSTTFDLSVQTAQGVDVQITDMPEGPFAAGEAIPVQVEIEIEPGTSQKLEGALLLGPPAAPEIITAPIEITRLPEETKVYLPVWLRE